MTLHKVVVEGRRIETAIDGERCVVGFVATRWVHADSPEAAGRQGVALVRKDMYARAPIQNAASQPPELVLVEVCKAIDEPTIPPGFVWYRDDGEDP